MMIRNGRRSAVKVAGLLLTLALVTARVDLVSATSLIGSFGFPIFQERVVPGDVTVGDIAFTTYITREDGMKESAWQFSVRHEEPVLMLGMGSLAVPQIATASRRFSRGVTLQGLTQEILGSCDGLGQYEVPAVAYLRYAQQRVQLGFDGPFVLPQRLLAAGGDFGGKSDWRVLVIIRGSEDRPGAASAAFGVRVVSPVGFDIRNWVESKEKTWPQITQADLLSLRQEQSEGLIGGIAEAPNRGASAWVDRSHTQLAPGRTITIQSFFTEGEVLMSGAEERRPVQSIILYLRGRVGVDGLVRVPAVSLGVYGQFEPRRFDGPVPQMSDPIGWLAGFQPVVYLWQGDQRQMVAEIDQSILPLLPHRAALDPATGIPLQGPFGELQEYLVIATHSHNGAGLWTVDQSNELWLRADQAGTVVTLNWSRESDRTLPPPPPPPAREEEDEKLVIER